MAKFMVLYRAPAGSWERSDKSPEDMKKGMEEWMKWKDSCGDNLLEMGNPLGKVTNVSSSGAEEGSDDVAGYSILECENMNDAVKLVENHPHLKWTEGCTISLYEMKHMS